MNEAWEAHTFSINATQVKVFFSLPKTSAKWGWKHVMGVETGRQYYVTEKVEKEVKGCAKDQQVILFVHCMKAIDLSRMAQLFWCRKEMESSAVLEYWCGIPKAKRVRDLAYDTMVDTRERRITVCSLSMLDALYSIETMKGQNNGSERQGDRVYRVYSQLHHILLSGLVRIVLSTFSC